VSERQTDSQLMRACAEHRSERAFAELVRRLVDSARENFNFFVRFAFWAGLY